MYSLKEKLTKKLSLLFADSNIDTPSSPSFPYYPSPSSSLNHSQAMPYSKEGKSLYSFSSQFMPAANSEGMRSNKQESDSKPIESLPTENNEESLRCQYEPLNCDADCSPVFKRIETPIICEEDLYEFLHLSLPNIVKGCQWVLLYSTLKHGISLRTLIRNSAGLDGPCLLMVRDMQGAVFGGLLDCPLKPTAKRKYQGTNQTFVFTTIYGAPRLFRPTGANRYFYMCANDLLALGGGGNFALSLDGDLLSGTSGACDTFGSLCLAHSPEFELKNVELWGFTHSSKFRT